MNQKNNSNCKDGKCLPKTLPNQEPENKPLIPLDFKVVKPFIKFGKHFNEVDVSFYNFDIRKDFREYHFKDTKNYEVLPYISASDTILQFTLPYEKEFDDYTYLLLNIWDKETLWRIHSKQTIYYSNKFALQFDCKRDFFNEYFGLFQNNIELLTNLYVLRSSFLKPSFENMRICSSACLNDTMPEQVKLSNDYGGKKLIKDDEYRYQWLWEIKTTNVSLLNSIMSEAMPRFGNMFFEAIKQNVPKYSKASKVFASYPSKGSFSVDYDNYSPTWPLPDYRSYYFRYNGYRISRTKKEQWRVYFKLNESDLSGSYASNILIDKDKTIRGFTQNNIDYLYWSGDRPQIKRGYISGGKWYERKICVGYDNCDELSILQLAQCSNRGSSGGFKWCWENSWKDTFCGEYEAHVENDIYFDYLSIDKKELRLLKFDSKNKPQSGGNWPTIDKATVYDGQEPYSVFLKTIRNDGFINDIADRLRISWSTVLSAYSQTITNFMTYVKNQFGNITFQEVRVENATIDWGSTAYSDFYLYDYEGNTTGRTSSNLFEIQVAKEIRLRTIPIYQKQRISNHYEAAHIKDFIVGNSLGVFEVKRYLDYEARNRDSGEQIVYSATLPELYENGSITIELRTLEQIGSARLELEKTKAFLELQNKQGDETTRYKINTANEQLGFNRGMLDQELTNKRVSGIWNLVGSGIGAGLGGLVGKAIGGGFAPHIPHYIGDLDKGWVDIGGKSETFMNRASGIGLGLGGLLGKGVGDWITAGNSSGLQKERLEFNSKQQIQQLWDDNEMSKRFKQEQYDLNQYFLTKVSGHLVNVARKKFPWITSYRALYLLRVKYGDKEKIEKERDIFGDFINQYYDINKNDMLEKNYILVDTNKSDVISLPKLDAIGNEIIKGLLAKGIFIHKPERPNASIVRVW